MKREIKIDRAVYLVDDGEKSYIFLKRNQDWIKLDSKVNQENKKLKEALVAKQAPECEPLKDLSEKPPHWVPVWMLLPELWEEFKPKNHEPPKGGINNIGDE